MHLSCADRPDECFCSHRTEGEHNKYRSRCVAGSNGQKPSFNFRMVNIGRQMMRLTKNSFDLGQGQTMFLAFLSIAIIPIKSRD